MKRITAALLALCLAAAMTLPVYAAPPKAGFENFREINTYAIDSFADVSGWFAADVASVYSLGLMEGSTDENGERSFRPGGKITLAETVTLACRIRSTYLSDGAQFEQRSVWYQSYVDYAVEAGILSGAEEYEDYTCAATRAQFAAILAKALPEEAYREINAVEIGAIPDVSMEEGYSFSVYKLYRAGILTGSDGAGTFKPDESITRGEAAAITARIVAPDKRLSVALYAPLYVGFTMDNSNQGGVVITGLSMTTEGELCYLTMEFKSQTSRFLSIMNASESLYILKVVVIDPGVEQFTFAFPLSALKEIYEASSDPAKEQIIMEFYASGDPGSVTDRFYIAIDQFSKYFAEDGETDEAEDAE